MIVAFVEWWAIVCLSFTAFLLEGAYRRTRYHDNVLPFRR